MWSKVYEESNYWNEGEQECGMLRSVTCVATVS